MRRDIIAALRRPCGVTSRCARAAWRGWSAKTCLSSPPTPIRRSPWPTIGGGGRSRRSSRPPRRAASISRTPTSFTPTGSASFSLCWPWPLHSPTQPANGRRNTGPSSSRLYKRRAQSIFRVGFDLLRKILLSAHNEAIHWWQLLMAGQLPRPIRLHGSPQLNSS